MPLEHLLVRTRRRIPEPDCAHPRTVLMFTLPLLRRPKL